MGAAEKPVAAAVAIGACRTASHAGPPAGVVRACSCTPGTARARGSPRAAPPGAALCATATVVQGLRAGEASCCPRVISPLSGGLRLRGGGDAEGRCAGAAPALVSRACGWVRVVCGTRDGEGLTIALTCPGCGGTGASSDAPSATSPGATKAEAKALCKKAWKEVRRRKVRDPDAEAQLLLADDALAVSPTHSRTRFFSPRSAPPSLSPSPPRPAACALHLSLPPHPAYPRHLDPSPLLPRRRRTRTHRRETSRGQQTSTAQSPTSPLLPLQHVPRALRAGTQPLPLPARVPQKRPDSHRRPSGRAGGRGGGARRCRR